ncbi:MAG: AAA family ATPase [Phycisphaerales bacterium]
MAKKTAKKSAKKTARKGRGAVIEAPPMPEGAVRTPAPAALGSIIGQDRAVGVVRASIASGRLHHAWIFHGPAGVGKFTTALAFAAVILDPTSEPQATLMGPGEIEPDPGSETQRLLRAGTHPDLHVIVKELARFSEESKVRDSKLTTIPKDVIDQHLIRPAKLAPRMRTGARATKVFIVDEAELMDRSPTNAPVQNAILKTLEEPPEGTVIVLVTSSEDRLLPTIRSRCQRVAFTALAPAAMDRWLDGSGLELARDEREWLLAYADGSPGRLERAHRDGQYAWHRAVGPMLARADAGEQPFDLGSTMSKLVDEWAKAWVDEGAKVGENRSKESANRDGARQMLALVAQHYRGQLTDGGRARRAVAAIEMLGRAERLIGSNVQVAFVMDDLAAGLGGR